MADVLIILPTYNEAANLAALVQTIRSAYPAGDILVVDDHSPDGTGQIAVQLAADSPQISVLHRPGKAGLGAAYQAGFAWALEHPYQLICTMDADLSHDPAYLPQLVADAGKHQAIALGSRYVSGGRIVGWPASRYALSWGANLITKLLLGLQPRDVTAGYKCYPRAFLENLNPSQIVSAGYAFQVEMIAAAQRMGWPIIELPITFTDRAAGRSKVSRHELISSMGSLFHLVLRRRGFRQAGRFALVGGFNILVDLGVTNLLVLGFGSPPNRAGYLGTGLALASSFWLNRHWTFRARDGGAGRQFGRFLLANGLGALLNAGIYTSLLASRHYNLAKLVAIAAGATWNFLTTKYWAFRTEPDRSATMRQPVA